MVYDAWLITPSKLLMKFSSYAAYDRYKEQCKASEMQRIYDKVITMFCGYKFSLATKLSILSRIVNGCSGKILGAQK